MKNLFLLWLLEIFAEIALIRGDEADCSFPSVTAQARYSSSWLLPVYIQHLCNPDGERHMWQRVCVWFGAADGCKWQTVASVGTLPRDYSDSCLCVVVFCSCAPLSKRALSGFPHLKLYLTWQGSCQASRFQYFSVLMSIHDVLSA